MAVPSKWLSRWLRNRRSRGDRHIGSLDPVANTVHLALHARQQRNKSGMRDGEWPLRRAAGLPAVVTSVNGVHGSNADSRNGGKKRSGGRHENSSFATRPRLIANDDFDVLVERR